MVKTLVRFETFKVETPILSSINTPFNNQDMFKGKSPNDTEQCRVAYCPVWAGPSSKLKGRIWGKTEDMI